MKKLPSNHRRPHQLPSPEEPPQTVDVQNPAERKKLPLGDIFTILMLIVVTALAFALWRDTTQDRTNKATAALVPSETSDSNGQDAADSTMTTPLPARKMTFYADHQKLFELTAFDASHLVDEQYQKLPERALNELNDKFFDRLKGTNKPLAASGLFANHRLKLTMAPGNLAALADKGADLSVITRDKNGNDLQNISLISSAKLAWMTASFSLNTIARALRYHPELDAYLNHMDQQLHKILFNQESKKRGDIKAISDSITMARTAAEQQDFDPNRRQELERFKTSLNSLERQTRNDVYFLLIRPLKSDRAGTKNAYESAMQKYKNVQLAIALHNYVVNLRMANWYVRALYPGQNSVKNAELDALDLMLSDSTKIVDKLLMASSADIGSINAFWNWPKTLNQRREAIRQQAGQAREEFNKGHKHAQKTLQELRDIRYRMDGSAELIIEMDDGKAVALFRKKQGG